MGDVLSSWQKKVLRNNSHQLKPSVIIGKAGVTENLLLEVISFLSKNGLIKIKVLQPKENWQQIIDQVTSKANCQLVGQTGKILVLFQFDAKCQDFQRLIEKKI